MFSKTIVLSDAFLDMPLSARCLYFTLGMLADDDGFVNSPRAIMRQCGASEDDMKVLIAKCYLIPFESGIVVIKHWRINNYLRCDRYQQTKYREEKERLVVKENGAYTLVNRVQQEIPFEIPDVKMPVVTTERLPLIKREPKNELEIVEKAYLLNYQQLYEAGVLKLEKPIINWTVSRKQTKDCIEKYGLDVVLQAVEKSRSNDFCIQKGYVLTTILSAGVMAGLINGTEHENVSAAIDEHKKEEQKKIVEAHPRVCSYCGTKLLDSSGILAKWFCQNCRREWGLRGTVWVEI